MTAPVEEIRRALAALFDPGQVVELRVLNVGGKDKNTASGYFDDHDVLADQAARCDGKGSGVYVVLNEINPALLARRANRIEQWAKLTTADHDVIRRRWLPVDFDCIRPAGISTTDAEHDEAIDRARDCAEKLTAEGWPTPLLADSGNGAHLLYPIDLPNDEASLTFVRSALEAINGEFGDERVKVDLKNFNAARIWKLYGTLARKGDDTPDRPHRRAHLLELMEVGDA